MQPGSADSALVRASLAGDAAEFGTLVERHYPSLRRICLQVVGEHALAEDCAQDAVIVAWLRLSHLRAPEAFPAWLNGIGRHVCQHALRAQTVAHRLDVAPALADDDALDWLTMQTDIRVALREAIDDLPPGARAAVRAFYLRGLDYTEAAAALGISLSALKVRLHDARGRLRHRYRLRDPESVRTRPFKPTTLAIHEAAHAVLYCRYGRQLRRVSIAPVSAVWVAPGADAEAHMNQLPVLLELQARMAGEVATLLGRNGVSGGDRDEAGVIALRETGGDQVEAALLLERAWRDARALLESSGTWRKVERVAAALLEVGTMDGDDVRKLCARAT
jgi:RNA polymerase sigma factor (sigma-70 family)